MYTYSHEHQMYLKKLKRTHSATLFLQFFIAICFFALWELAARCHWINSFLFSSPFSIFQTLCDLFQSGELFHAIWVTLYEVFISFSLSSVLGIFFAFLFWSHSFCYKVVDPYLTILNSLPKVSLGPLIIIWVGASMNSIIFMALTISLFTTILSIYHGFVSVYSPYITMAKSFGANKYQIFFKIIFPSNFSTIISALKINISLNLIGVIMGELLVSKAGLGYLIMYGSQVFNLDLVISSVALLALISYVMYYLIEKLQKRIQK